MSERLSVAVIGEAGRGPASGEIVHHETMVVDVRDQLRPAEMVERKLVSLLRTGAVQVSHVSAALRTR